MAQKLAARVLRHLLAEMAAHTPIHDRDVFAGIAVDRETAQQEAAVDYQRTVLSAWHEVDNALGQLRVEHRFDQDWVLNAGAQVLGGNLSGYGVGAIGLLATVLTVRFLNALLELVLLVLPGGIEDVQVADQEGLIHPSQV